MRTALTPVCSVISHARSGVIVPCAGPWSRRSDAADARQCQRQKSPAFTGPSGCERSSVPSTRAPRRGPALTGLRDRPAGGDGQPPVEDCREPGGGFPRARWRITESPVEDYREPGAGAPEAGPRSTGIGWRSTGTGVVEHRNHGGGAPDWSGGAPGLEWWSTETTAEEHRTGVEEHRACRGGAPGSRWRSTGLEWRSTGLAVEEHRARGGGAPGTGSSWTDLRTGAPAAKGRRSLLNADACLAREQVWRSQIVLRPAILPAKRG
jgi:hypothetical protein